MNAGKYVLAGGVGAMLFGICRFIYVAPFYAIVIIAVPLLTIGAFDASSFLEWWRGFLGILLIFGLVGVFGVWLNRSAEAGILALGGLVCGLLLLDAPFEPYHPPVETKWDCRLMDYRYRWDEATNICWDYSADEFAGQFDAHGHVKLDATGHLLTPPSMVAAPAPASPSHLHLPSFGWRTIICAVLFGIAAMVRPWFQRHRQDKRRLNAYNYAISIDPSAASYPLLPHKPAPQEAPREPTFTQVYQSPPPANSPPLRVLPDHGWLAQGRRAAGL